MVESVNPTYYAARVLNSGFVLKGKGFSLIPNDAIGLYSNQNNNPLVYRQSLSPDTLYVIENKTNTTIEFVSMEPLETHGANYLGAIVSADRQTIYWINETMPLP